MMEWEDIKTGGLIPNQLIERYEGGSYRHGISINPLRDGEYRIYFIQYPPSSPHPERSGELGEWNGRFLTFNDEWRDERREDMVISEQEPFKYVNVIIDRKEWVRKGNIKLKLVGDGSAGGFWEGELGNSRCNWHIDDQQSSIYVIKNLLSHSFINWTTNPLEVK